MHVLQQVLHTVAVPHRPASLVSSVSHGRASLIHASGRITFTLNFIQRLACPPLKCHPRTPSPLSLPVSTHPQLKANFLGTEYMLWGRTPDKSVRKGYAAEKLCINFKQTALNTTGGPRTMYVVLPMPDSGWQPTEVNGKDSLSNSLELARHRELPPYLERKMAMMCTKPPEYDESIKGVGGEVWGEMCAGGGEAGKGQEGAQGDGSSWKQALQCSSRGRRKPLTLNIR